MHDLLTAFTFASAEAVDFLAPKRERTFGAELLAVHDERIVRIGSRQVDDRVMSSTLWFASPAIHGLLCLDWPARLLEVVVLPGRGPGAATVPYANDAGAHALHDWLAALDERDALASLSLTVSSVDALRTQLAGVGALLERCQDRIRGADGALRARVAAIDAAGAHARARPGEPPVQRAIREAAIAFRQRRLPLVTELLAPHAAELPALEQSRLAVARQWPAMHG